MVALSAAVLALGCGPVEGGTPNEARIHLSGPAGTQVRVVISTEFIVIEDGAGQQDVRMTVADTAVRALPFETLRRTGRQHQILIEVRPAGDPFGPLHLRVDLDGAPTFHASGSLEGLTPTRFVYARGRILDTVRNVF